MAVGVAVEAKGVIMSRIEARVHGFVTRGDPSTTSRRVRLLATQLRISRSLLPTISRARSPSRVGRSLRRILAMPDHLPPTAVVATTVVVVPTTMGATETSTTATVPHARRDLREGAQVARNLPRPPAEGFRARVVAGDCRRGPEVTENAI
jgi:hypothetical protein